ncbi:hypothetical protein HZS_4669, partial [Henneguya salminicola]
YNIKDYIFILSIILVILGLIAIFLLYIKKLNIKREKINKYNSLNNTELNWKVFRASNKVYINLADNFKRPKNYFRIEEETEKVLSDKHMSKLG